MSSLGLSAVRVDRITSKPSPSTIDALCELLQQSIDGGAPIGFVQPTSPAALRLHWQAVFMGLGEPGIALWVARDPSNSESAVGYAQLSLSSSPAAGHRARFDKLVVHPKFQNRKVGTVLLYHAENYAKLHNRRLVFLNTAAGSVAEKMFQQVGYSVAGHIPDYEASPNGQLLTSSYMFKKIG